MGDNFATYSAVTQTRVHRPSTVTLGNLDIYIKSPEKPDGIKLAEQGEDPHAIVIPCDWYWPNEWTSIKDAYPDFVGFAADPTHQTNTDWYKNPTEGKVYGK